MYVNKCIKCGAEFETKNPKRVICPNCLYADKGNESTDEKPMQSYSSYSSYSADSRPRSYDRPQGGYRNNNYNRDGGYNRDNRESGYQRREGGYQRDNGGYRDNRGYSSQGGYNRDNREGGYQRRESGYQRDNREGGYNRGGYQQRRPQQGGFRNNYASARPGQRRPMQRRPQKPARPLLISKEQLEQIEALYKTMLPLPNPDCHEVIGAHLGIEPQKVFFGINLVRQKMMLPKLPFPKRKLAITPDQMMAIKALYEPLLPLPPIGCHKIIAAQLKMDEWRVHVGIKLIRAQLGLDRWNEERADKPADYMVAKHSKPEEKTPVAVKAEKVEEATEVKETVEEVKEAPIADENATEEVVAEKPKRGRKPKKKENEE